MHNFGKFWVRFVLIAAIVSCGGSGKNETTNQNNTDSGISFFQLRANVDGLNGTMVISNNGKDEVSIQQNGLVTFPNTWTKDAAYDIKVMDEPCSQRCVVDLPQGQILTTGTKTLSISCSPKTWEYPLAASETMSLPNTQADSPSVAMNKFGDMMLTWNQTDYYNLQAYQRTYENRQWTSPSSIPDHFSFAGYDVTDQSISFNDLNQGTILWSQMDGNSRKLFIGDYENGYLETPAVMSNSINVAGSSANQYHHVVGSNAMGEKIAVWAQTAGTTVRLYKAEYRNGTWTLPTNMIDNINPDGTNVSHVDVAINDLGDIIIVWQQSDGTYDRIYKSEYHNGIWTHPTGLTDEVSKNGSGAYQPKVAINNSGDAYITWFQYDNAAINRYQVFVAEYHNGSWKLPSSLSDNISPNGKHSKYAEIVVNDAGKAEIVSLYRVNDTVNIFQVAIQQKNSGGGWSSPRILSTTNATDNPTHPVVDMDQQGNILVAWALQNTGKVYKSEYRNGNWLLASLSDPINFNTSVYDYPAVAVNNCRATLVWQQNNDAGLPQIYLAQYH